MERKYFLTTFENAIRKALGPVRGRVRSLAGAPRQSDEKAAYTSSWLPPTAIAQAQHPFLEISGLSPPLVSHWLSTILPPLGYSANQNLLTGGAFARGAERGLGLAPLETATWLKKAGLFLN